MDLRLNEGAALVHQGPAEHFQTVAVLLLLQVEKSSQEKGFLVVVAVEDGLLCCLRVAVLPGCEGVGTGEGGCEVLEGGLEVLLEVVD